MLWVLIRSASARHSNEYPQQMSYWRNRKNITCLPAVIWSYANNKGPNPPAYLRALDKREKWVFQHWFFENQHWNWSWGVKNFGFQHQTFSVNFTSLWSIFSHINSFMSSTLDQKGFSPLSAMNKCSRQRPGPSCSKLTMSLVNDSLKFKSSGTQICWIFLLLTFFQQKISEYCILNLLKQLTKWPLTSSLS